MINSIPKYVISLTAAVILATVGTQDVSTQSYLLPVLLEPASRAGDSVAVLSNSPIYLLPDENREPLRIAKLGSILRVKERSGDWLNVEFQDPQFGRRTGYIQARSVRAIESTADAPPAPSVPNAAPVIARAPEPAPLARSATAATPMPKALPAPVSAPPPPTPVPAPTEPAARPTPIPVPAPTHEPAPLPDADRRAPVLSDREIADAIRIGTRLKGGLSGLRLLDSEQGFMNALAAASTPNYRAPSGRTGFSLRVYTPKTWVEQLASNAAKEYRPFTAADVSDEMLEPVMRVIVYPDKPTYINGASMSIASSASHVVLRDERKNLVLQPLSKEPFTDVVSSALRDMAYQGLETKFPMSGVSQLRSATNDGEFLIVVIGEGTRERIFKVKQKHFSALE